MMKQLGLLWLLAKANLTGLGLALFYSYLTLAGVGLLGILYTLTLVLEKWVFSSTVTAIAWWEIVLFAMTSCCMARLFYREAMALVITTKQPEAETEAVTSNVIPFRRQSRGE